jgi:hypothetical protein
MGSLLEELDKSVTEFDFHFVKPYFEKWLISRANNQSIIIPSLINGKDMEYLPDYQQNLNTRKAFWGNYANYLNKIIIELWDKAANSAIEKIIGREDFWDEVYKLTSDYILKSFNEAKQTSSELFNLNEDALLYEIEFKSIDDLQEAILRSINAENESLYKKTSKLKPDPKQQFYRELDNDKVANYIIDGELDIPATFAVWSHELNYYAYIAKADLTFLLRNGYKKIAVLYDDINCISPHRLILPLEILKKELVITKIANRRMMAYFLSFSRMEHCMDVQTIHDDRIAYYLSKQSWQPIEAAALVVGIEPERLLDTEITADLGAQWRQDNSDAPKNIVQKIRSGFYDNVSEFAISEHSIKAVVYMNEIKTKLNLWDLYSIIKTFNDFHPLKILDQLIILPIFQNEIGFNYLEGYEKRFFNLIQKGGNSDPEFSHKYPHLNSFLVSDLNKFVPIIGYEILQEKQDGEASFLNCENEQLILLGRKGGRKSKKNLALQLLASGMFKRDYSFQKLENILVKDYCYPSRPRRDDILFDTEIIECTDLYLMNIGHEEGPKYDLYYTSSINDSKPVYESIKLVSLKRYFTDAKRQTCQSS